MSQAGGARKRLQIGTLAPVRTERTILGGVRNRGGLQRKPSVAVWAHQTHRARAGNIPPLQAAGKPPLLGKIF